MKSRKPKKTERDILADKNKLLMGLLISEASGGIIPLPKGAEEYKAPTIPFTERKALVDMINKALMVDMKMNPESEESGFELLTGELNDRKRNGKANRSGRISPEDEGYGDASDSHDDEIDGFDYTRTSGRLS